MEFWEIVVLPKPDQPGLAKALYYCVLHGQIKGYNSSKTAVMCEAVKHPTMSRISLMLHEAEC